MKFSLVLCFTEAESGGSLKHAIRVRSDGAAINTTTRAPTTTGPGNGCRTDQLSLKNYVFFYNSNQCIHVCTAMNNDKFILYMIIGAPDL